MYRVVFDVTDRFPDIALAAAAIVLLASVGLAAWRSLDTLLGSWPFVLAAGAGLFALVAVVDRQPIDHGFAVLGLAFGTASELYNRRLAPGDRQKGLRLGATGTSIGAILMVFAAFGIFRIGAIELSRQLAEGRAEIIEGPVTIYLEGGGKSECISVAGRDFCYSDFVVTNGFNRTRALGGPMRDGLQVRLSLIGETIVRVEVADTP